MRELNVEPAAGPVSPGGIVQVVDAGTWAAAAQRHLMRAMVGRHRFLLTSVGLKDDARAFRDDMQRTFSGLRLFPLAMIAMGDRAEITRVHAQAVTLVKTRPELITDWMWKEIGDQAASAALDPPAPPATWFTPFLPAGTAFDSGVRTESGSKEPRFTESQIAELRRRAPFSLRLVTEALRWKGDNPSHATLKREYGAIADYNLGVAKGLAVSAWDQPEIYIPQMEFVCRMSADAYWDLAPYLADHGRTADARRAYEQWLEKGRNQVAIANGVDWLVRHYFEKGEIDKANAVANRVADVHSFWGLVTRANLHEWLGDLEAAERVHRTAWRRYDNPNELLAFYLRHNRTGSDVDELMTKVFPNGLMRTAAPPAATPPLDGVVIVFAGMTGFEGGLRAGDVITAVDGIRVKNFPQYRAARGASDADQMRFTIWRDGVYKDVAAPLRHRWIVSTLRTYEPRSGQ
jgi:hypothetical protein